MQAVERFSKDLVVVQGADPWHRDYHPKLSALEEEARGSQGKGKAERE